MTERVVTPIRHRSYAGASLASAGLAGFDLRGLDFTGADLHDADLSRSRSGMTRGWEAVVVGGALVLSVALGALVGAAAHYLMGLYRGDDVRDQMVALYVGASVLVFLVVAMWRGIRHAVRDTLPVMAALAIAAGAIAVVSGAGNGVGALAALAFLAIAAVIVVFAVLARATAGTAGKVCFMLVSVGGALAAGALDGGLLGVVVSLGAVVAAKRSEARETTFPLFAHITSAIASRGGTSFRNANLEGANFADAELAACDFRGANLDGAHFDHAKVRLCRFDFRRSR